MAIFVVSRIGVLLVASAVSDNANFPLSHALLNWDGHWYMAAAAGYVHNIPPGTGDTAQSNLGFFPVLPILMQLVHLMLGIGYGRSGLLVGFAAGLSASVAVWWMLHDTEGVGGADRGTTLLLFSPGAFVLSMVYSEGLLITAVAGVMLALRRRRWVTAGLLAAVASATDPLGIAALLPCALAARAAIRRDGDWRAVAAPALAPLGVIAFFAYLWAWVGTPFAWFIAQRRGWQGGSPGTSIPSQWVWVVRYGFSNPNDTIKAAGFLVVAVMLVYFIRTKPEAILIAYVAGVLFIAALSPIIGWTPRVALRAFPLVAVVGARLPRPWYRPTVGVSALTMAAVASLAWGAAAIPFTP